MLASELLTAWSPKDPARRIVAAVSGGADSVAMLLAMIELGWKDQLTVAHFNHQWRGDESDADQQFVADLCRRLAVPLATDSPVTNQSLTVGKLANSPSITPPQINTPLTNQAPSPSDQNDFDPSRDSAMLAKDISDASHENLNSAKTEEAARQLRYHFLIRTAYEIGASYVATAHTADDRIETVLHNLLRGTGLRGIASLNVSRPLHDDLVLVRPLLNASRRNVEDYLKSRGQAYRIDSSNHDLDYARNFLRHELLPLARSRYARADANLLRFSEVVEETLDELNCAAKAWLVSVDQLTTGERNNTVTPAGGASAPRLPEHWRTGNYWILPAECLGTLAWPILREALRIVWLARNWPLADMSRQHWHTLRDHLLRASPQASTQYGRPCEILSSLPGNVRLERFEQTWAIGTFAG